MSRGKGKNTGHGLLVASNAVVTIFHALEKLYLREMIWKWLNIQFSREILLECGYFVFCIKTRPVLLLKVTL